MKRGTYNSVQVLLHWLLAVAVIISLAFGTLILKSLPNDPAKILPLRIHMLVGAFIGVLIVASTLVRIATEQPERKRLGNPLVDALAVMAHLVLRIGVIVMVTSGVALAIQAGLLNSVFGNGGASLPHDFWQFAPRRVHAICAAVLIAVVGLHILASVYHQFVRKDGLMARMWFRAKTAP